MAAGFPAKADYATGDVLTAANMNDLAGTVNLINPSAKGDLYAGSAANTYTKLTVGANNTVLTADSSTATGLKWATPASGGMTQLATGSLSGASVSITSISGSYKHLELVVKNYKPATDNTSLSLRLNNDTTASRHRAIGSTVTSTGSAFTATSFSIAPSNDDTDATGLSVTTIFDYANTTTWKMAFISAISVNPTDTTTFNSQLTQGFYNQTGAITRLDLFPNSGNFTSGDYILYGVS